MPGRVPSVLPNLLLNSHFITTNCSIFSHTGFVSIAESYNIRRRPDQIHCVRTPTPGRVPYVLPNLLLNSHFITTNCSIFSHTGFVSIDEGYHILDGVLIENAVSERQCLDACLMFSTCLSVDYNIATNECFAHNTSTYCMDPTPKPFCRHYKRAPCVDGKNCFDWGWLEK